MLLFPERTKFKKYHKNYKKLRQKESNNLQANIGCSALKALKSFRFTSRQIEAVRKTILRVIKRKFKSKIKMKLNVFPFLPITKKSSGIRMGKGKGNVEYWCFLVKKGRILFEFDFKIIPLGIIFSAFLSASTKLPVKSSIVL